VRQIEFLDTEIAAVERLIAQATLGSEEIRRLMSVPGVNVIVAASFLAAIGEIRRFQSPRKLAGYLGLDPRVRQSGPGPATLQARLRPRTPRARRGVLDGRAPARSAARVLRARPRAPRALGRDRRRGAQARVPVLVFAHARDRLRLRPAVADQKKLRRLELTAGHQRYTPEAAGIWHANDAVRQAERELARQAETAYARTVRDYHAARAADVGASATPGRASNRPSKGKAAP